MNYRIVLKILSSTKLHRAFLGNHLICLNVSILEKGQNDNPKRQSSFSSLKKVTVQSVEHL